MSVFAMEYKQLVGLRAYPTTNHGRSYIYINIFWVCIKGWLKAETKNGKNGKSLKNLSCSNLDLFEVIYPETSFKDPYKVYNGMLLCKMKVKQLF